MKRNSLVLSVTCLLLLFVSCKKINEATDLGSNLIPGVDNINTFDTSFIPSTNNRIYNDTTRVRYDDHLALGHIDDPEFGPTHANFAFNVTPSVLATYPFLKAKDSISVIDSVVLSLAYTGAYGDTAGNGVQTVQVREIPQSANFSKDSAYRFNDPLTNYTTGTLLGTKTYTIKNLADSQVITRPGDTTKVANVLRIQLNASLGTRFRNYDTSGTSGNGAYFSDSAFLTYFKGLSITSANSGNALAYFLPSSPDTKLTIYYKYKVNGQDSTASLSFLHSLRPAQANYVQHTPGANWAASLNNASSQQLYIQSSPSGSYVPLFFNGLTSMNNRVIQLAELIAYKVPSADDNKYTSPGRLFVARKKASPDSLFILNKDLVQSSDGSYDFSTFGGTLRGDQSYRFNITRYLQDVITNHRNNDTLWLYAPLRTDVYVTSGVSYIGLPINGGIGYGREVLASSVYSDPTKRLRLRIIYSRL